MKDHGKIRAYVFEREQGICRCCRLRKLESMHELRFRSLGGKVSKRNSVGVCGDGVRGCHGFLQRLEIAYVNDAEGAEGLLQFSPSSKAASDWMRVPAFTFVCSLPGGRNDELETC